MCVFSGCFLTHIGSSRFASSTHLLSRAVKIISHILHNYSLHIEQILHKMEVLVLNNSMVNSYLFMPQKKKKKKVFFIETSIYKGITLKLDSKHFLFCSILQSPSLSKLCFLKSSMYVITSKSGGAPSFTRACLNHLYAK